MFEMNLGFVVTKIQRFVLQIMGIVSSVDNSIDTSFYHVGLSILSEDTPFVYCS